MYIRFLVERDAVPPNLNDPKNRTCSLQAGIVSRFCLMK